MLLWTSEAGEMDVKQLYGRNDMVMLDKHNKIYGSLGIAEQTILKTEEGNPVMLKNPKPGVAESVITDFKMQGWTEQAQYEGNQLFDASVFDGMEKSGVSVSVTDGVITASGMSETVIWIQAAKMTEEDFKKFKSGNIYVKNYKTADCNYEVGIYINNTTVKEGNFPYPIPDGYLETKPNNVYFFIDIRAGIELKGSCKPMIYQDGDGTWEPYTGGQPSPNPDYPQTITSAGKYDEATGKYQYEVKLTGANLFNPNGEIVVGSVYYGIPLNNKGIVSMSLYEKNPDVDLSNIYFGICSEKLNSNEVAWAISNGAIQAGGKKIVRDDNRYVCWYPRSVSVLQKVLSRYDVMVNYGDGVYLPHQPYKEQTVLLQSDRPLTKWDRLEKRNGQWGWVYKSAEIVLDGSEDWVPYPSFSGYYSPYILPFSTTRREGYSDRGYVGYYSDRFSICIGVNNSNIYVCFAPTYNAGLEDGGIDNWKNFLSENPITIITYLDEETFIPLSASEQEQMNTLEMYLPTTVITNDVDCSMIVTYKTTQNGGE